MLALARARKISIHTPRKGSDIRAYVLGLTPAQISIHTPRKGSDLHSVPFMHDGCNFNPRSPRGGATSRSASMSSGRRISIHAPHEGERHYWRNIGGGDIAISIHAPHEGERPIGTIKNYLEVIFQSTLPTRGSDGVGVKIWAKR